MAEAPRFPKITLTKQGGVRLSRGHLWVFSNEIAKADPEVKSGGEVAVFAHDGEFLGSALYNKHALIAARIYSSQSTEFTSEFITAKLKAAIQRRGRYFAHRRTCRLVFSEADGLPGLIVDQYEKTLSIQLLTLAMDQRREQIVAILEGVLNPAAIVERSDSSARSYEGLEEKKGVLFGEIPEELFVDLNGLHFRVDPLEGQKTGIFLDQVENWNLMRQYAPGKRVLDLFCNVGGFSLNAAFAGAASVKSVDTSDQALSQLLFSAERNGLADKIKAKKSDAFLYVRSQPEMFDVIVCDPPAFAKSRKQLDGALRGYREVNRQCMKMLTPGGILLTFSCSAAVSEADFDKMLTIAARDAGRQIRLLPGGGQPHDHAPLLSMPETRYLKSRVVEMAD